MNGPFIDTKFFRFYHLVNFFSQNCKSLYRLLRHPVYVYTRELGDYRVLHDSISQVVETPSAVKLDSCLVGQMHSGKRALFCFKPIFYETLGSDTKHEWCLQNRDGNVTLNERERRWTFHSRSTDETSPARITTKLEMGQRKRWEERDCSAAPPGCFCEEEETSIRETPSPWLHFRLFALSQAHSNQQQSHTTPQLIEF